LKELTVEVKIGTSAKSISSYTIFGISPVFEESRRGVTLESRIEKIRIWLSIEEEHLIWLCIGTLVLF